MSTAILPKAITKKLARIMRNFWWGHNYNSRKLHFINWDIFLEDKVNGGLGIRELEDINIAQIAKLIWKFLEHPDCMWVQIMTTKYCRNVSLWEANVNGRSSSTWKAILECRKYMENKCLWAIGNGENIQIFKDPWVPDSNTAIPETQNSETNCTKVKELWLSNPNRWNDQLVINLFSPSVANKILSIYIHEDNSIKDKLLWLPHPHGKFSTKSFIKSLKDSKPSSSDRNLVQFPWKIFWKVKNLIPKIHIFIWRVIHNGIVVLKVMGKFNPGIEQECRLCGMSPETTDHLFLNCQVARAAFFWFKPWAKNH